MSEVPETTISATWRRYAHVAIVLVKKQNIAAILSGRQKNASANTKTGKFSFY